MQGKRIDSTGIQTKALEAVQDKGIATTRIQVTALETVQGIIKGHSYISTEIQHMHDEGIDTGSSGTGVQL